MDPKPVEVKDAPEPRYNIIRFFRVSGRRKVIARNVSRAVAVAHCSDPNTRRAGVWFDGMEARRA